MSAISHTATTPARASQNTPAQSPFAAVLAAVTAAKRDMDTKDRAHDAAQEALAALSDATPETPIPAVLTIYSPPIQITRGDNTVWTEGFSYTYRTADHIEASTELTAEAKVEMLQALRAYQADKETAERKAGIFAATRAVDRAHRSFMAAYRHYEKVLTRAVLTPVESDQERRKQASFLRELDAMGADFTKIARDLILRPVQPTEPTPPPSPSAGDASAQAYLAHRQADADYGHFDEGEHVNTDVFQEAYNATRDALLKTAPVDLAGIAVRLNYIIGEHWLAAHGDWDCPHCLAKRPAIIPPTGDELDEGREAGDDEPLFRALATLALGVEALAAKVPAAQWESALAVFQRQRAADRAAMALSQVADEAVEAEVPTPEALTIRGGGTYYSEGLILQDRSLTPPERLAKLAIFRQWKPLHDAARAAHNADALAEVWEQISTWPEELAVFDAPAPHLAAVAEKLRLHLDGAYCDRLGQDIDTPETISELLFSRHIDTAFPVVRIYQDVLRLAGVRPDLSEAPTALVDPEAAEAQQVAA